MRAIRIQNPILDLYVADLAAPYNPATSLLTVFVRSNNSFQPNDLAVFGNPSQELTELKKINTLTSNSQLNIDSALNFSHIKETPVYKTIWDFVSVEGAQVTGGQFIELTKSPIQWDNPKNKTVYLHQAGTDTWLYRFRFYNSVTQTYSEYSPTLKGGGFDQNQVGYIIQEARVEANDEGGKVMDTNELLRALTRGKNIARANNPRYWFWKVDALKHNINIPILADTTIYDLAVIPNFGTLDKVMFVWNNGATSWKRPLERKTDAEFDLITSNMNQPAVDHPSVYRLLPPDSDSAVGYIEVNAKMVNPGYGKMYPNYYMNEPDYNSVEDKTLIPMPEIYVDYLLSRIFAKRGNDTKSKSCYQAFIGPENRERTLALKDLSGLALLDLLDRQSKEAQGSAKYMWRFRGQKGAARLAGGKYLGSPDYNREAFWNNRDD